METGIEIVRRVEGLIALADPFELLMAKASEQVDQFTHYRHTF